MYNILSFLLFIIVVIIVYSLLNYYFIRKHSNIITAKSLPAVLFRMVIFTIILTPVATIIFSLNGLPLLAAITGFTGYGWLAFLFLFLVIHGTADIILFFAEKAGFSPPQYTARVIFFITMFVGVSILVYGSYEAKQIKVERLTFKTDKLPATVKKITIVQISDIHFSPMISVDTAERIKEIVQKESPDMILSTGDLLDRGIRDAEKITEIMSSISAPMGKYAIPGNHEFISGIKESVEFTEKNGFKMLRNEVVSVKNILNIAGVDDPIAKQYGIPIEISENELLSKIDQKKYTIFMKHQPKIDKKSMRLFDVQLSGHTHAGQIFPFTIIVKMVFPYICGLYKVDNNTILYVNRGAGTWGPPIRFLAPPEITVIELKNKKINK